VSQRTRSRRMTNDQDAAAAAATARLHSGSNARGVHQPDAGRSEGAGGFGRPGERPRASRVVLGRHKTRAAERGYGDRCILTRHRRMTMGGRPRASCLGAELGAPTAEQGKEAAVCDPTRRRSNARERQGVAWGFKIPGIFPPAAVAGIGCRLLPDGDASKARSTAIRCGAAPSLTSPQTTRKQRPPLSRRWSSPPGC
jgi:hypothetical protein